jgi:Tfp pilus assembly PilM family ATPase
MAEKSEEYILGIEISEQALRVVQRHLPSNVIDLAHIEPFPLPQALSGKGLAMLLRRVARIYRPLLRARIAAVSLPYSTTFIRALELDSGGDLKEQIEWEIEQAIVGKSGNYAFDWTSPPAGGIGGRTLVVAAEEERIRWMEDSCRKVKIVPVVCDADVLALINIFAFTYPGGLAEGAALIYLTGAQALICLTVDGNYVDSERIDGIKVDSEDAILQSVKLIEDEVAVLSALSGATGTQGPLEVKRCFLCGDAAADARVRDPLLAAFKTPVEILNPFRSMFIAEEIKSQVLMAAPALAVVAGLTLRTPEEGAP